MVRVNLASRSFDTVPPFDRVFAIAVKLPSDVQTITLVAYGPAVDSVRADGTHVPNVPVRAGGGQTQPATQTLRGDDAVFDIAPIRPNRRYLFRFRLVPKVGAATPVWGPDSVTVDVEGTASADLRSHFDTDFGVLWSPRPGPGYVGAGSNVHFYFVPINKDETLGDRRPTFRDQIAKRVSVFGGLAFVRLHASTSVENRYEVGNLVAGVGVRPEMGGPLRWANAFRLNSGLVYFRQHRANPLLTDQPPAHAPFLAATGDIDLKTVFGPLTALLGIK